MNKQRLEDIYIRYANEVYKYLVCLTKDADLSEELTQETFYQATKTLDKFRGDCKVSVWLCQIAKRLWYKELSKRKHESVPIEDVENELTSGSFDDDLWKHLDTIELFKQLHDFDEKTKEVMYLRLTSVLSFKEIGDILGESETWARVTFYRGKQKLLKGRLT